MNARKKFIAFYTITYKEVYRFLRLWTQTLIPPVITNSLYYTIFGAFIGSQVAPIGGYSYMQFIVPGLVMMAVITSSFSNVVTSFYMAKFQRNIEELLVSPTPYWIMVAGYIAGGVVRGVLTGIVTLSVALFFTDIVVQNVFVSAIFMVLTAALFSFAGLLNGLYAKSFDGVTIFPTFVLTPLTYLGGVFYSVRSLPPFWQRLSEFNPILYLVDGFRYGFLGFSDAHVGFSISLLLALNVAFALLVWNLFRRGIGLRS